MPLFDGQWPGIPKRLWPRLNKLCDLVESSFNWRCGSSDEINPQVQRDTGGMRLRIDQPPRFQVVITGGNNPYTFRSLEQQYGGLFDSRFDSEAKVAGTPDAQFLSGTWGPAISLWPLYERHGITTVPPGSVVWIEQHYTEGPDNATQFDQEWMFDWLETNVPAKASTAGAPTTTLNGAITAGATSMVVASVASLPYRKSFRLKIDNEVVEVTADAVTTMLSISRGKDGTTADAHANGATVTFVGGYAWTEELPPVSGNDLWADRSDMTPRSGTQVQEPARDRNHNCFVPDGTFVLVRKKSIDGAGSSTAQGTASDGSILQGDTSLTIAARDSFPQRTPFYVRMYGEMMRVTAGAGTGAGTFTVVRGQYGTYAMRHEANATIVERICEWVFEYCCKDSTQSTSNFFNVNITGEMKTGSGVQQTTKDFPLNANQDPYDASAATQHRMTPSGPGKVIKGIVGEPIGSGGAVRTKNGAEIAITNLGTGGPITPDMAPIQLAERAAGNAADNIENGGNGDYTLEAGKSVKLKYNGTTQSWFILFCCDDPSVERAKDDTINSTQDPYDATKYDDVRLSATGGDQIIKGFKAGKVDGVHKVITNVDSGNTDNSLLLQENSATSAANNIYNGGKGTHRLAPKKSVNIKYNLTTSQWWILDCCDDVGCRLVSSGSAVSIGASSIQQLNGFTTDYKVGGANWDVTANALTIPIDGVYQVGGCAVKDGTVGDVTGFTHMVGFAVIFKKNGVVIANMNASGWAPAGANSIQVHVDSPLSLAAGDVLTMFAQNGSSLGSINCSAYDFWARKVGDKP